MTEDLKNKIILVDDDDFLLDMYATKFGNSGIVVISCKSGEALFEALKTESDAKAILLDIVMPGMNGLEILEQMRKDKLAENIPVIMLTNQNDENDVKKAQELGVKGYIVKSSATPSEVVDQVMQYIRE
jgi:CheY-like chemotaxis protein